MEFIEILYLIVLFSLSYLTIFHLILWFENKSSLGRRPKNKNLGSISILVPAFNEEKTIGKVLENLLKVDYPKNKLEIIVIDDGSTDNTHEIAKKYESKIIRIFRKKNEGKAAALNFGINLAKNDYIAVVDADSFLDKNALKACMSYFDSKKVAGVTSHILVKEKSTLWEKLMNIELMVITLMRKAQERLNVVSATPGPLSIYKKDVLVEVGKFNTKILVEDVEIAWRLLEKGYKIRMALDALAYSLFPDNIKNWWRQRTRWNIGGMQTLVLYMKSLFTGSSFEVGRFLVPLSIWGYSMSAFGIGLFLFLLLTKLVNYSSFVVAAYQAGVNPFASFEFTYMVDLKIVYSILIFILSLFVLRLALSVHKEKVGLINLIFFLTLYAMLFPINTIYSLYKIIKGEKGWLTK